MKLKHLRIENFRGVRELEIDFISPVSGQPRQLTCLIGDNGSGKTTVLQAIALVLSLATRKSPDVAGFRWYGFLPERVSTLGATRVELEIAFDDVEIRQTAELFERWRASQSAEWLDSHRVVEPAAHLELNLVFDGERLRCSQGYAGQNQFLGRYYIRRLLKTHPFLRDRFANLGDVFSFDQYRNLARFAGQDPEGNDDRPPNREGWQAGVNHLRQFLVGMWGYHTSPDKSFGRDYIDPLERKFADIFPGTRFRGIRPRDDIGTGTSPDDYYFLLEREGKVFDIAEMSSGEQAVFPLLYEFVRLEIARSIVLIDELELHLHPPQQQALLAALPKLGPDCQFIITTHSPHLTNVIPDEEEVRLEGGVPCL